MSIPVAKALVACMAAATVFIAGMDYGASRCHADHDQQRAAERQAEQREMLNRFERAQQLGTRLERQREAIDATFNHLAAHAAQQPADPVDGCVLPAERLQLWAAANAGTAPGAAAAEPHDAAPAAADAALGGNARPGAEPPRGGAGLPPAGEPAVRAAGVAGGAP